MTELRTPLKMQESCTAFAIFSPCRIPLSYSVDGGFSGKGAFMSEVCSKVFNNICLRWKFCSPLVCAPAHERVHAIHPCGRHCPRPFLVSRGKVNKLQDILAKTQLGNIDLPQVLPLPPPP